MTIQYVNTGFILSLISDDSKGTTIFLLVLPQNCLKVNKRDAPVQKCKIRPFGCLVYRLYSFLSNLLSRSKSCLEQLQIICLCETCPFPWSSLPGDLRNSGRFEFISSSQACFKLSAAAFVNAMSIEEISLGLLLTEGLQRQFSISRSQELTYKRHLIWQNTAI